MQVLNVEVCRRFLAVARESQWYELFALALTTGMRPSEYLALKWNDIDWQRSCTSVSRTIQEKGSGWTFDDTRRKHSRRVVKLQSFVSAALMSVRNSQLLVSVGEPNVERDSIFRSSAGDPLKQNAIKREFRRLLDAAGIRTVRLYDLRHTAATLAISAGVWNWKAHRIPPVELKCLSEKRRAEIAALVGGDQGSAGRLKWPTYVGPRPLLRRGTSHEERF
jgi:integrase